MPHAENEWEYDSAERVSNVVDNFEGRGDNPSTLLHLRWLVSELLRHVKLVHLTEAELISVIAVVAPVAGRPVINEFDYDVRERVADALKSSDRHGLAGLEHLRWQLRELMQTAKIIDLSVPELAAMLAIFSPANGRRLLANALEQSLRPILSLVNDAADLGDAAAQLIELGDQAVDQLADTQI
jgi:hypothetical protein